MGGEWASGATLVSETWPAEHRGKALAFMQSAWAIGYALAAAVNYLVQPAFGWRSVFFVGILPAFLTIWVRRSVREPEMWRRAQRERTSRSPIAMLFSAELAPLTVALTMMNACTLFGWWSFNLWLPSYLQEPVARGGLGLQMLSSSTMILVMQLGMWLGYITFGFVSDRIGRKRTYIAYLLLAAVFLFVYVSVRAPLVLLALGPLVAFFATGYFSGFGAVTAEIFPTTIRGTAQGFTYNIGRIVSAAAPFTVGTLAQTRGFGTALSISSVAFVLAAIAWIWIPETRGRALT
jgi:MFS family permease